MYVHKRNVHHVVNKSGISLEPWVHLFPFLSQVIFASEGLFGENRWKQRHFLPSSSSPHVPLCILKIPDMSAMFEDPSMYERASVASRTRQQSSSGELSHNGMQMDGQQQQLQQQSSSEYHHHQMHLQQQQLQQQLQQQQQGQSSGSDTDFGEGGGALGTEPMPHGLQDVGEMLSFINNHKLAQNRPMYQQPPAGSSHSSGSAPHRGLGVRGSVAAAAAIAANDPKWVQPSGMSALWSCRVLSVDMLFPFLGM